MLVFQFLLFLAAVIIPCHDAVELNVDDTDLNQYIQNAVASFKLKIHQAAQRHEYGVRRRRSLDDLLNVNVTGKELLISSIEAFSVLQTNHSIEIQPFKIGINQYIAVVNNGDKTTASEIYQMKNGTFKLIQRFNIPGCVDFEFVEFQNENYVIFVENNGIGWHGKTSYDRLYHVYRYIPPGISSNSFYHEFHVKMHGGTSVKGFLSKDKQYFVAANSINDVGTRSVKSTLHVKTAFGILLVQEFDTEGAEDVEVFVINGLVYLAFACHKNDDGLVDIYSKVYREKSVSDNAYISFEYVQRILTHGARDFEHFEMKRHHYIVVANEFSQLITYEIDQSSKSKKRVIANDYGVDSVIYWWSGKYFVEWQRIPTAGAMRWSAFTGPDGTQLLTVANSKSQALIYVYDPRIGLFKPTKVQGVNPYPYSSHIPDVRSVKTFSVNGQAYLAVANYNQSGGHNIFKLNYEYKDIPAAGPTVEQQLRKSLDDISTRVAQIKVTSMNIEKALEGMMTVDGAQTAWGNFSFENITIKTLRVKGNVIYRKESKNNPIEKAVAKAMELKEKLAIHEKTLKEIERRLNDSVSTKGSSVIIGEKIFAGDVVFNDMKVNEVEVGKINGVNLTDLSERAWSKSKPQLITGKHVFMNEVKMLEDIRVNGTVNGIHIPQDVMTTNTDQRIRGKKMFTQPVGINGNIHTFNATINDLRIPEDLVLRHTRQRILGKKIFKNTVEVEKSIIINGTTNGRDLSEFSKQVVTLSTNQVINGNKTFINGFSVAKNLDVSGLVDGVNLTEIDLDAARIDQPEVIRGKKIISGSVTIGKNMSTFSTTNGMRLQDDIMTTSTDQVINVSKIFNNINIQGNIITTSTINGIDLSEEAVTKSGDQTILGEKTFSSDVTVDGNIDVRGTVDDVNITEFSKSVMRVNDDNVVTAPKIFTGKVTVGNMSVQGRINGVNLTQLRSDIWTIDGNHVITEPMTFENLVINGSLNVSESINGAKFPDDFIMLKDAQTIENEVTFEDGVVFESGVDFGANSTLNGEHFPTFLNSVVLNGTNQSIHGRKIFKNDLSIMNDMTVDGTINGYKIPDDFITLNTDQNITGTKIFHDGITINGTLYAGIINVTGTVNGVDVSELPKNAVYKGGNQTISGNVVFTGNVSVLGPLKVGGLVDGVNITELAETAVRLSKPQDISGEKRFLKDVEFYEPVTSPGTVNGVNISELDNNSLKKTGDQYVSGTKIFEKTIHIGGDLINGTINGINLEELKQSVVTKDGTETINGDITFLKSVSCVDLKINGTLDNVSLSNVMLTFGDQVVKGRKTFIGDVSVRRNLTVDGLINGVDVQELDKNVMKTHGDQTANAQLVFKNGFHANNSIEVNGLVNGVNISEMDRNAVRIDGAETILGKKTFLKNITVNGNVNFEGPLNGINITDLLTDVMSKTKNQTINGRKTFTAKNGVKVNMGLTTKNIIVKGFVDGVNITELNETAVKLSTDQELYGNYTFLNRTVFDASVEVNGLLNGVNISSDVMLTYGDQTITGIKVFKNMIVNASIGVSGKVDGVDISEFAASRVTLTTNQTIYGRKSFESGLKVTGNIDLPDSATINGVDISEEVLYVDDNPVFINGKKTFLRDLVVKGDLNVSGLVKGLNVSEMDEKIVRVDDAKELITVNTFTNNLTVVGNITCAGYINGFKINEIVQDTEKMKNETRITISSFNQTTPSLCRKMRVLLNLTGAEKRMDGIERVQDLAVLKGGYVDAINIGNEVYVAVARPAYSGCGDAHILRCNAHLRCEVHMLIKTQAIYIQFYEQSGDYFAFVGHYGSYSTGCPSFPEILKFDQQSKSFTSLYNVTSHVYGTEKNLSLSDTVVQNIASLIPTALLTSPLHPRPIVYLGTLSTSLPTLSRVFSRNGVTYLVQALATDGTNSIELSNINKSTLAPTTLQKITTSEVTAIDIGYVEERTMLIVAEGRPGSDKDVKLFSFFDSVGKFYFFQKVSIAAVSLHFTNIFNQFYFVFANPDFGFGICPWKGAMGFDQCTSVLENAVQHIAKVESANGVFLVGVKNTGIAIYQKIIRGASPKYNGTLDCSPPL